MPPKNKKTVAKKAAKKARATGRKLLVKRPRKTASKAPRAKAGAAAAKTQTASTGTLPVFDRAGKTVSQLSLDTMFQGDSVNQGIVYQAVLMYQAGAREGTAATKDRGHVRGGGKKPWKQKGTGQARHGSRRSPIWRGGGVTFGPMPRDYSYQIPAQLRRRAVIEVMKDKLINGKVVCLDDLNLEFPKTKLVASLLDKFKLEKPLVLVEKKENNLLLASRNIPNVSIKTAQEVNALDVVSHAECLMTKSAYAGLVKRLKS